MKVEVTRKPIIVCNNVAKDEQRSEVLCSRCTLLAYCTHADAQRVFQGVAVASCTRCFLMHLLENLGVNLNAHP